MKIFLSWSGEKSKALATCLRDWLPHVIQSVDPWMSEADIDAGARWNQIMSGVLSETKFGIICLTSENQSAPWIMFEAGAIAKTIDKTHVCPLLIDMGPSDIKPGPLTQFQAKTASKEKIFDLLKTINRIQDRPISERILKEAFENNWPVLEKALGELPEETVEQESRSPDEMIAETLEIVRGLSRIEPKPSSDEVLVEELEIGVRTYNLLKRAGINTISDIRKYSPSQMRKKFGLSEKNITEIKEGMSKYYALEDAD